MTQIYLDNASTTRTDPRVVEAMRPFFGEFYGNASSLHAQGYAARKALEDARTTIAASLGAQSSEILFTSGGTESNNLALKGLAFARKGRGNHIITTKVEHKSILKACRWLETQGFTVTYLDVDKEGILSPEAVDAAITPKTILVSVIHGNNEIGAIADLEAIGKICARQKVAFHSDACQSYTKVPIDVERLGLTMLTINAHKIHGPKGIGALYIKKGTRLTPLLHGGEHEFRMRAGTENVPAIVGFAKAVELADTASMAPLRDRLIEGILAIPGTRLNGPRGERRLCNNVNISFTGIEGESIEGMLDAEGICSSTGSACSEASLEPSYVLKAIGLTDEEANGSLRLTLSHETTAEEIDKVLRLLPGIIERLRELSPIGKVITHV